MNLRKISKRWIVLSAAAVAAVCVPLVIVKAQMSPPPPPPMDGGPMGGPGGPMGGPGGPMGGPGHPGPPDPMELPFHLPPASLDGAVSGFTYSPRGTVAGILIKKGDQTIQLNCPPDVGPAIAEAVTIDEPVTAVAEPALGLPDHPVYELNSLKTDKGQEFKIDHPGGDEHRIEHVDGKVKQLNYGRHGEVDGVQLDNGDFVHTGPEAAVEAKLAVGSSVRAEGFVHPMLDGHESFEARSVNGVEVHLPPPPPGGQHGPGGPGGPEGRRGPWGPMGPDGRPGPGGFGPDGRGPGWRDGFRPDGRGPGGPGGFGPDRRGFDGPGGFGGWGAPDGMGGPGDSDRAGGPDGDGGPDEMRHHDGMGPGGWHHRHHDEDDDDSASPTTAPSKSAAPAVAAPTTEPAGDASAPVAK